MIFGNFELLAQRGQRLARGFQTLEKAAKNNEPWVYWCLTFISIWLLVAIAYVVWFLIRYFATPRAERPEAVLFGRSFIFPLVHIIFPAWIWYTIVKALMA